MHQVILQIHDLKDGDRILESVCERFGIEKFKEPMHWLVLFGKEGQPMPRSLCSLGEPPEPSELLRYAIKNDVESIKIIHQIPNTAPEVLHLNFEDLRKICNALNA